LENGLFALATVGAFRATFGVIGPRYCGLGDFWCCFSHDAGDVSLTKCGNHACIHSSFITP